MAEKDEIVPIYLNQRILLTDEGEFVPLTVIYTSNFDRCFIFEEKNAIPLMLVPFVKIRANSGLVFLNIIMNGYTSKNAILRLISFVSLVKKNASPAAKKKEYSLVLRLDVGIHLDLRFLFLFVLLRL